jgi:hypothetical protein
MPNDKRQPLLMGDVARLLKLGEREVLLLEARRVLRAQRTPGGLRIFRRDQVERVAAQRAQQRETGVR